MIMSTVSHLVSAWFAFFLPSYGTWKALSHRPVSEPELERWAMYWSVLGTFVAFEYVAEWFISFLPFYWEIKTLFLLFLSLPQTQGSTWLFTMYLQPLFAENEAGIDARIVSAKANILKFAQDQVTSLYKKLLNAVGAEAAAQSAANPLDFIKSLASVFGPQIAAAADGPVRPSATPSTSSSSIRSASSYSSEGSSY